MRGQHREVALQSRCPKILAAPQSTGAAQLGKHPVEIGHDEIEVRFAPLSRRLGVGPDLRPGVYFPAYFGNSVQAVWPARQNSPGSASASARYFVMTVPVRDWLGPDAFRVTRLPSIGLEAD